MKRRHLLAGGIGAFVAPSIVRAEAKFPDRTIRLVVPFPAGGATDVAGRMFADKLSQQLGQSVIVDNKGGAAGSIGSNEVKSAKPDGYTLLVATSSTHAINPTAFVHPPYDPIKDFTPIASICVNPLVFYNNPQLPPTMMEFVDLIKKNPGKYSYGSAGIGSIIHLAGEYLKRSVGGMDIVHVPYKGGAPAIQDTVAGNIACSFETFSTTLALHRAKKLRILAYCHSKRAPIAPEIPTMSEAGVKGYECYTFALVLGPAGMPQNVIDTLDQASRKVMADPTTIKFLEDNAAVPTPDTTPERTAKFIKDELTKWAPIIRDANVRIA
jgi:tripartite-type tricarboxylate transporter receptor subunit TctC